MMHYKTLPFSKKIKLRNVLLWVLFCIMLAYMVIVSEVFHLGDSRYMTRLANIVSDIILFGGMIWVQWKIAQNKKLLRNRLLLKDKQMQEMDERNQYLHDKSGGIVWDILLICLLFITTTAALSSMPAFYTSFTVLVLMLILKTATYYWYSRQ